MDDARRKDRLGHPNIVGVDKHAKTIGRFLEILRIHELSVGLGESTF